MYSGKIAVPPGGGGFRLSKLYWPHVERCFVAATQKFFDEPEHIPAFTFSLSLRV
jgi:hypothetical protein